jgi:hypothetical protein
VTDEEREYAEADGAVQALRAVLDRAAWSPERPVLDIVRSQLAVWLSLQAPAPEAESDEPEDDGSCSACHGSGGGDYPMHCGYCSGRGYARRTARDYDGDDYVDPVHGGY